MFNRKEIIKLLCIYLMVYYLVIKSNDDEKLYINIKNFYVVLLREKRIRNRII